MGGLDRVCSLAIEDFHSAGNMRVTLPWDIVENKCVRMW